jgi:intracellular sulfur oxidation DsrE/DsrF family protein
MKKLILFCAMLTVSQISAGQTVDYNVVFDITSGDTMAHKTVMRQAKAISSGHPDAQLEVVVYGGAIDMVLKDKSKLAGAVEELAKTNNTAIKVCAGTMKRFNIKPDQLIAGVEIVSDGIYEIISKQQLGWGYIKISP